MRAHHLFVLFAAALTSVACSSHSDDVCQDIGDCSQRGDSDWIATCQGDAKALSDTAAGIGCAAAFNRHYSCADSNYSCQGAAATFPGCDQELAALDDCTTAATVDTACAKLQAAEAACTTATPAAPLPACTALRNCQAACYLAAVANDCAVLATWFIQLKQQENLVGRPA